MKIKVAGLYRNERNNASSEYIIMAIDWILQFILCSTSYACIIFVVG